MQLPAKQSAAWASLLSCLIATTGCGTLLGQEVTVKRNGQGLEFVVADIPITTGSGNFIDQPREVPSFQGVSVQHGLDVVIAGDGPTPVLVTADDNLAPLVETVVEEGILQVRVTGSLKTSQPIRVEVNSAEVTDLHAATHSRVTANSLAGGSVRLRASTRAEITAGAIEGDQVTIKASTSGRVTVTSVAGELTELTASTSGRLTAEALSGEVLKINASTSGRVTATGAVTDQQIDASTSGKYDGSELACETATVSCSTSGTARVNASRSISGSASTSGKVHHRGTAKVNVETSTSGKVIKAG